MCRRLFKKMVGILLYFPDCNTISFQSPGLKLDTGWENPLFVTPWKSMSKQGHVEELCTYTIVKQYLNNIYVYTSQLRCFVYTYIIAY